MKLNLKQMGASLLALICILGLSSFGLLQDAASPKDEVTDIHYRSTQKQERKKGKITLSSAFQNDYFTDSHREGYFYVQLEADQFQNRHYDRPSMNLSIVIDRSGSMSGQKIQNAKKAAKHIVDQLGSDDYLSIVVYDNEVNLLHSQSRVNNKESIKNKIDGIKHRGATNLMGGAMKGYSEVQRTFKRNAINRVLLLSDGLANEGITDQKRIEQICLNKLRENNIAISTFGVGTGYNENLMTAMAEKGSGNYYFIAEANQIAGIFKKELNGLMEVVAQNTTLEITVPDFVRVQQVYGHSHIQRGNQIEVKMNDVFSEETRGVLLRYSVDLARAGSSMRFQTKLNFRDVSSDYSQNISLTNVQRYTNSSQVYNDYFNEWVDGQVVLHKSNQNMEMAMKAVDKGDYVQARKLVKENRDYISTKAPIVKKSEELRRVESATVDYDQQIKNVEEMDSESRNYMQKANKSTNYMLRSKKR